MPAYLVTLNSAWKFLAAIPITRGRLFDNLDGGRLLSTLPDLLIIRLELFPTDKRAFTKGTGTAFGYLDPRFLLGPG